MQYLFFIGTAPDSPTAPSDEPENGEPPYNWVEEMDGRGVRKFGDRLRPAEDATTVRVRGGDLLVTDGPFVEGKEYIAGIDVIECADLDEAIEIASKHPMAAYGLVEIRPFWPFE
ncbi:YciI family protein [Parafrigoribacterium soli]|uniref:YciI family protein n=1 Tax=Parafrigoribacterium soli TaxID=3144663 RepID=UPI0032EDD313